MFILVCRYNRVFAYPGDDVTLTSHLSPETSAVDMEVRWFRGIECIYLYKNKQVTVGRGYEGRLSLFTKELQLGNISLLLKDVGQADTGIYSCQVISGENRENRAERTIHLYMSGAEVFSPERCGLKIAEQDSLDMEESVHSLEMKKLLQKKEKELQDKIAELESTTNELRRVMELLQDRDAGLDGMRKVVSDREVRLNNMASQLEAFKQELEMLALKLQEKEGERKVLLEELQARARVVQELTVILQEKEQELEQEKKQRQEEREQLLHAVNEGGPSTANAPHEPLDSELVEKTKEMLSEMYEDPSDQLDEIERWIYGKRQERRTREEEEKTEALEKEFVRYALMMKEQMEEEHGRIVANVKVMANLEKELEHAATEEERGELELELKEALERHREGEAEMDRLAKEIESQRNAIEDIHKHEIEEIREKYEVVSRIEAETNLLKIILPDVQAYFRNMTAQFRQVFEKQIQALGGETMSEAAEEGEPDLDRVEDSDTDEVQGDRMSPIEEEPSSEMLEVSEQIMDAEQPRHNEDGQELSEASEETLHRERMEKLSDARLVTEITELIYISDGIDSDSETLELQERPNMVNGMKEGWHGEVRGEIGAEEQQEEVNEHEDWCEEDLDNTRM